MIELWPILYEDKPERASSTQRKVVLLFSQTGVTSPASFVPLGCTRMPVGLCSVPGLRVVGHNNRDNFSIGGIDLH